MKLEALLTRAMEKSVSSRTQPCAAMTIYRGGHELFRCFRGFADIEASKMIDADTVYRLYSLTKPVTAVTAMTLIERGEIDLLTPVCELLPGFRDQQVWHEDHLEPAMRPVTVRDLFSMTSGNVYPGGDDVPGHAVAEVFEQARQAREAGDAWDTLRFVNELGKQPLHFQPGTRWEYGTSADILGAVIEAATGKRLIDIMHKRIFAPLGMKDTNFYVPKEKFDRLMPLYAYRDQKLVRISDGHLNIWDQTELPAFLSGGAGLFSTLDDMSHFARMLAHLGSLGGERVISPASVRYLGTNHLTEAQSVSLEWDSLQGFGYGGLMRVMRDPGKSCTLGVAGEFGWDGWTGPYMTVCPEKKLSMVVMQQRTDCGMTPLVRQARNMLYSELSKA